MLHFETFQIPLPVQVLLQKGRRGHPRVRRHLGALVLESEGLDRHHQGSKQTLSYENGGGFQESVERNIPIIMVGNKSDLRSGNDGVPKSDGAAVAAVRADFKLKTVYSRVSRALGSSLWKPAPRMDTMSTRPSFNWPGSRQIIVFWNID